MPTFAFAAAAAAAAGFMFTNAAQAAGNAALRAGVAGVATVAHPTLESSARSPSEPDAAEPLQLDRLVAQVLAANPSLLAMQAAVREARARVGPAGALADPVLTYQVAPLTAGGALPGRGLNHHIALSQPIPWPGTLGLRAEAASRRADGAAYRMRAARLQVARLARSAYAEWLFLHRALAVNAANQALLERLKESAAARYAAGGGAQQDILRAEREAVHLQHDRLVYQRQRVSVRAQINALLNRPAGAPLPPPAEPINPRDLPPLNQLREVALASHPRLRALQAKQAAAQAGVGLAKKAFYPDFKLLAGYNSLWDPDEKRWTVGASISLPLNRDRRHAELDAARAARQRAEWKLADARAQLAAELTSAYAAVAELRHTIGLYAERLLPLARATLDAALAGYESGSGGFLGVIEAEQAVLQAQLGLARARADYRRHLAALRELAPAAFGAVLEDLS